MIIHKIIIPICLFFFFAVSFSGEGENGGIYDQETELCWTDQANNLYFSQAFVKKIHSFNLPEERSIALCHYKKKITTITYGDEGFLTVTFPSKEKMRFPLALIEFLRGVNCQEGSFDKRPFQLSGKNYLLFWSDKKKFFTVANGGDYSDPTKTTHYRDGNGNCFARVWDPTEATWVHYPMDSCPDDLASFTHNQKH